VSAAEKEWKKNSRLFALTGYGKQYSRMGKKALYCRFGLDCLSKWGPRLYHTGVDRGRD
jgi:hypothetical protein